MEENKTNVVREESAIKKYISDKKQIKSDEKESLEALQTALYEAVYYGKSIDLSDAMYELTEYISGINAKLTYRSYRLTEAFPCQSFRFSEKDAAAMLELYKLRSIYIVKRELISRALSTLSELNNPPSLKIPHVPVMLEEDVDSDLDIEEDALISEIIDSENENLESFRKNPLALTELIPELIADFEKLLLKETRPLSLITILESIDDTLDALEYEIGETNAVIEGYKDKKQSVLIKKMMVLNRLKDILADV